MLAVSGEPTATSVVLPGLTVTIAAAWTLHIVDLGIDVEDLDGTEIFTLVDGASIVVEFADVGRGLMAGEARTGAPVRPAEGAPLRGFEIAGRDGIWREADAAVRGDTVVVRGEGVARPAVVRYAWSPAPSAANLYNRNGFPALPFETR